MNPQMKQLVQQRAKQMEQQRKANESKPLKALFEPRGALTPFVSDQVKPNK
jgi:hypothetical protein